MLAISLIREYLFCPRILYFYTLSNISPKYPLHVNLGHSFHLKQDILLKSRSFARLKLDNFSLIKPFMLKDEELGIYGIFDLAFLLEDEVIPLEYKNLAFKKLYFSHKMQLSAYGMLLERLYKKTFKRAIIVHGNNLKCTSLNITKDDKSNLLEIIKNMQDLVKAGLFPSSSASDAKCLPCEFLNYCDDRF